LWQRCLSLFPVASAAFAVALLNPALADEPSAQELITLKPAFDSTNPGCKTLEVGGWLGDGECGPTTKLSFRALYRSPGQLCLLLSDTVDGTPLALFSGKSMLLYDHVTPTLYYSTTAGFSVVLAGADQGELRFNINYRLTAEEPSRIVIDFGSLFSFNRWKGGAQTHDSVVRLDANVFQLVRSVGDEPVFVIDVDPARKCPYTRAAFGASGTTKFCMNRLNLDSPTGGEPFAFPTKEQLGRAMPVTTVTGQEGIATMRITNALMERAAAVRSVVNRVGPGEAIPLRGLSDVDFNRVRDNDKKYAKALRELIPPSLREATRGRPG
jgi:hypothetical protein